MGALRRGSKPGHGGAGEALDGGRPLGAGLRYHREARGIAPATRAQLGWSRPPLGARTHAYRYTSHALALHRPRLHLVGRGRLAHLPGCPGASPGGGAHWAHRRRRSHEVRLGPTEPRIRKAVRRGIAELVTASEGATMKIRILNLYVDDQEKALRFYTEK